ncbi:endonuclease/exonuclease/phosphatase family protein [Paraliomyxa miuraensis]|uniref:endonuclease/exonuclease/phosphatase family protein n=1 Tax=Paraliomyxa miuraensis TaxID=376150 RepID=UPI002257D4AD|nr:endonuclease/exonuclease/phosphatase family protein [Paraliomyxa miuraensis]MCX4244941.1 endonuclease/exonuclease/phosphatase family protein [Paraliomyxa miuraensis]
MASFIARLRAPVIVALGVCAHAALRPLACGQDPGPDPRALRVVVWNLRNFPGGHDRPHLRDRLEQLDPSVLALQEVLDPSALPELLPGFRWHASAAGGRNGQHLVIGWDPERVDVEQLIEHEALAMGGRVRPALSGHVEPHGSGADFHLVVVHLKATRSGHAVRREQWPRLASVVEDRVRTDGDVLVVGDFNVAGGPQHSADDELDALRHALAPTGLHLWETTGGCTAYWDGSRRDRWWEPSRLDLVWSAGLAHLPEQRHRAWSGAHCAHHACAPFSASEHHPDPDLHGISDHCPIVIDLPLGDHDP